MNQFPSTTLVGGDFGVYVHIPFCAERCDYCAFVTYVGVDDLHEAYVDAVIAEITTASDSGNLGNATSVFFGGGTPSRLDPSLLGRIISALPRESGCEITAEVNPEDATEDTLGRLVEAGINRVSLGIQSTAPHVLADLGRAHRGEDVATIAATVASSGVASWSMDLIVGSKAEQDEDLRSSIADVLDHDHAPPHLSAYLLTVERGTPLSRQPQRHPDDDDLARRYEILDAELEARGYEWYEVSNFSKPGHECRHNRLYWSQGDYLGFGAAAHSHRSGRRSWNVANLTTYLERIAAGTSAEQDSEQLDDEARAFEALALRMRTREGVPLGSFPNPEELEGFIEQRGERLVLTRRGRLMADALAARLEVPRSSGAVEVQAGK